MAGFYTDQVQFMKLTSAKLEFSYVGFVDVMSNLWYAQFRLQLWLFVEI